MEDNYPRVITVFVLICSTTYYYPTALRMAKTLWSAILSAIGLNNVNYMKLNEYTSNFLSFTDKNNHCNFLFACLTDRTLPHCRLLLKRTTIQDLTTFLVTLSQELLQDGSRFSGLFWKGQNIFRKGQNTVLQPNKYNI